MGSVAIAQAAFFQIKCDYIINKLYNILKIFEDLHLAKSWGSFRATKRYKLYFDQKVGGYKKWGGSTQTHNYPLSDLDTAYIA
jgi:hypothetical protein